MVNFSATNMSADGDSFCSEMKRVTLSYTADDDKEVRTISIIAKYMPENEAMSQMITEMRLFDVELDIYNVVIPKMSTLAYREKVGPKVYYTSAEPVPIVLLQDLSQLGYKILERQKGLGLDDSLAVIEKLAYFHAASRALHEMDSTMLIKYNEPLFVKPMVQSLIGVAYSEVIKLCESVQELNCYVHKLQSSKDRILRSVKHVHETDFKIKVLNHGDLWIHNILFRFDEDGNVHDLRFIDFQAACFTSPCLDLHYLLAGNLRLVARAKQDTIIDHYFHCLVKHLETLHIKTFPNRPDFDKDFRLMGCYGFCTSILMLAIIKAETRERSSLKSFLEDDSASGYRHHCYNNENYLKEMFHYLPFYDSMGIFEGP